MSLLASITGPRDLDSLSTEQLEQLAHPGGATGADDQSVRRQLRERQEQPPDDPA